MLVTSWRSRSPGSTPTRSYFVYKTRTASFNCGSPSCDEQHARQIAQTAPFYSAIGCTLNALEISQSIPLLCTHNLLGLVRVQTVFLKRLSAFLTFLSLLCVSLLRWMTCRTFCTSIRTTSRLNCTTKAATLAACSPPSPVSFPFSIVSLLRGEETRFSLLYCCYRSLHLRQCCVLRCSEPQKRLQAIFKAKAPSVEQV